MKARYAGTCPATGKHYPAGTELTKGPKGWQIAQGAHVADMRRVELQPLAPEFGGTPDAQPLSKIIDVAKPMFCSCCRSLPGFSEQDPASYAQCRYSVAGDTLTCPRCGRTGHILSAAEVKAKFPPEERRCWECGRSFTYAECKRDGGDWNENGGYCGC